MPENTAADTRAGHSAWAFALIIIGSVIAFFATVNTWVERQALDTDAWVDVTDQLLEDDQVRTALSTYLVDELYANVDVSGAVSDALPSELSGVGPFVASALREPATNAVDRVLQTEVVEEAWRDASRLAHQALVAAIEDDGDVVSTTGGEVSIDLRALVIAVGDRLGLPDTLLEKIPEDAGTVVLFESDKLESLQDLARTVEWLSSLLFIVVVGAYALAVYLAPDRRRAVKHTGIGLIVVSVLVLIGRVTSIDALLHRYSQNSDDEPGRSVLMIGSGLLRQVALTEMLVGIFLLGFAILVGPTRLAHFARGWIAPLLRFGAWSAVGGGIVVFLVLLWLKPGGPISGWYIAAMVGALSISGVGWVQTRTQAEFPGMTFAEAGRRTAATVRGVTDRPSGPPDPTEADG